MEQETMQEWSPSYYEAWLPDKVMASALEEQKQEFEMRYSWADRRYDEDGNEIEEEEEEEEVTPVELKSPAPLISISAKSLVDSLKKNHEKFVNTVLNMPYEMAAETIRLTPPSMVDALATIRRMQTFCDGKIIQTSTPFVSILKFLYSVEEYEIQYLTYTQIHGNPPPESDGWSPPLIDVWKNINTFLLEPSSYEHDQIGKLCFGKPPVPPSEIMPSIVDKSVFEKNFAIFTENQFKGWEEWSNMVVIGGSVVASLLPVPLEYKNNEKTYYHEIAYTTSDIDVYFYGLDEEQFAKKVERFYRHLINVNGEVLVVRTEFTITFCTHWPKRHIQVVIGKWDSIPEILFEPDIDCTCVAYGGRDVLWATQRARFSFNNRCIIASQKRYSARGFPEYEGRLMKYSKRGFNIWDKLMSPDFSNISLRYLAIAKTRLEEHKTVEGRTAVYGLRLLLVGYLWPKTMRQMKVRFFVDCNDTAYVFKDDGLPYGPEWSPSSIEVRLREPIYEETTYGPYEVKSPYTLVQDVIDWHSIFSPHRDKLIRIDNKESRSWRMNRNFHQYIFTWEEEDETRLTYNHGHARCQFCYNNSTKDGGILYMALPDGLCCANCKQNNPRHRVPTDVVFYPLASSEDISPALSAGPLLRAVRTREGIPSLSTPQGEILLPAFLKDEERRHTEEDSGDYVTKIDEDDPPLIKEVKLGGDLMEIRGMISEGANIQEKDKGGRNVVHWAAHYGHAGLAKELSKMGANVNEKDNSGSTPLHIAIEKKQIGVVQRLLFVGADPNIRKHGKTPLSVVIANTTDEKAVEVLLKDPKVQIDVPDEDDGWTPLHHAAKRNLVAIIEMIAEHCRSPNFEAKNNKGETPLVIAVKNNNSAAVAGLCRAGAKVNGAVKEDGSTLLHLVDKTGVAIRLLKSGAKVLVARNDGETPLSLEMKRGNISIVKMYLYNAVDGAPLLTLKNHEMAEKWLQEGCNINLRNWQGNTPLFNAVRGRLESTVEWLKEKGANPNLVDRNGYCPAFYMHAISNSFPGMNPRVISEDGAIPPSEAGYSSRSPGAQFYISEYVEDLFEGAKEGKTELIEWALDSGAHVDSVDYGGMTALHWASENGHLPAVKLLLDSHANVNSASGGWETPLYFSAQNGHSDVVRELLERGAELTPIQVPTFEEIAAQSGYREAVAYLEEQIRLVEDKRKEEEKGKEEEKEKEEGEKGKEEEKVKEEGEKDEEDEEKEEKEKEEEKEEEDEGKDKGEGRMDALRAEQGEEEKEEESDGEKGEGEEGGEEEEEEEEGEEEEGEEGEEEEGEEGDRRWEGENAQYYEEWSEEEEEQMYAGHNYHTGWFPKSRRRGNTEEEDCKESIYQRALWWLQENPSLLDLTEPFPTSPPPPPPPPHMTPLHWASLNGHTNIVEIILGKYPQSVEKECGEERMTPLFFASLGGHVGVAEVLVRRGARVDKGREGEGGGSELVAAAKEQGHEEMAKWLVEHGAKEVHEVHEGKT